MIIVILLKHSSEAWIPWAISFKEAGKRCLGSPNVLKSWGWVLPTTFAPFIICRNFCWRLDIELGLAYVIVRHENGPNLTYSENCAVLLNFQRPILTRHAQVVLNKHVALIWSSSNSGLKNPWQVLCDVSCTWLSMADSICWIHILSFGVPRAALRKLRERPMQSTPFFIFLPTYDTYERIKYYFDDNLTRLQWWLSVFQDWIILSYSVFKTN